MIDRRAYYDDLLSLAREKRTLHGVETAQFGLSEARRIYKAEGIKLHYWPLSYKIKAMYMCADGYCSVAVQKSLPDEPKLFALIHELKHHYRDQEGLGSGAFICGDYNANELVEKGGIAMQQTMGDTWWTELRWRIALQLLLWGTKIAPTGDARDYLIELHLEWISESQRQWALRYPEKT